jgi:hypothetical protein
MPASSISTAVWLVAAVIILVIFLMPVRCSHPISKSPFRGCRRWVTGIFGRCRDHGRGPQNRVIARFGGQALIRRRTCDRCGRPREFVRFSDTGRSYLGCSGWPACKNPRLLGNYTL